ncbi:MAG: patatin-like phospholipase family protein [Planctomycetes bacterium]|nr:patatin-like phospholipase family protein [Planctomycetota bacterium]
MGDATIDTTLEVLRRSELGRGLRQPDLEQIAARVRTIAARAGQTVCTCGEPGGSMFIVADGRLRASVPDANGQGRLLGYLGRGDHFGEMALLTEGRRTATVLAVLDSRLLELDRQAFDELLDSVPRFAANLSRTLGFRLDAANRGRQRRPVPAIVAIVHGSPRARQLVRSLATALDERGERLAIVDGPPAPSGVLEEFARLLSTHDRVLLDLPRDRPAGELAAALLHCEEVLWLVEPGDLDAAQRRLEEVLSEAPSISAHVRVIWLLRENDRVAPAVGQKWELREQDLKVVLSDDVPRPSLAQQRSITRLVRHLQGIRVGVALGGGGARGMAHLGVLRALDRAGICIDLIAGTSSGAMIGLCYAAGYTPDEGVGYFETELTPHRLVRKFPGGSQWYLWTMFQVGAWDRKLRRYFHNWTFEQLPIPLCTLSVDLITGEQIVRDRGDAVNAVLESINLPMIARPICRDGMALVDGGILNNLPADVLVQRGAELIIGVDVVTKLPHRFSGMRAGQPAMRLSRPGAMETLIRVTEVQAYGINCLRAGAVDLLIAPDTSPFDFTAFSRTRELADAGEAAAEAVLPQLKQMLADLENRHIASDGR